MPDKDGHSVANAADFADYAAAMADELAGLARRHGLQTLASLLEMARLEAEQSAGRPTRERH